MKNANAKMMERIAEIENIVLGGFVLDDRGTWVSIADKKSSEEDFLVHLEAGRVLHNGRWVTFADANKTAAPPANLVAEEETASHPLPAAGATDNAYPPETALLNLPPAANQHPASLPAKTTGEEGPDSGLYAPETKSIQIQPDMPLPEEANGDDVSSYTMETGLFVVDRSQSAKQPRQSETRPAIAAPSEDAPTASPAPVGKKTKSMPVFIPASIPTWEKEESRQKKRGFIIGGIVVAAIGIAAIAVIVLQVVH